MNSAAIVEAALLTSTDEILLAGPARGGVGWMTSYGCGQPAFRMIGTADTANESNLTDLVVEVQQWESRYEAQVLTAATSRASPLKLWV